MVFCWWSGRYAIDTVGKRLYNNGRLFETEDEKVCSKHTKKMQYLEEKTNTSFCMV